MPYQSQLEAVEKYTSNNILETRPTEKILDFYNLSVATGKLKVFPRY